MEISISRRKFQPHSPHCYQAQLDNCAKPRVSLTATVYYIIIPCIAKCEITSLSLYVNPKRFNLTALTDRKPQFYVVFLTRPGRASVMP